VLREEGRICPPVPRWRTLGHRESHSESPGNEWTLMANFLLRLKLGSLGGELEIPFNSLDELGTKLKALDLDELSRLLSETVGHVTGGEERAPRPELEGICTVGPMGLPRFSKIPGSKGAYVALALYTVEPRRLGADEIETV